MAWEWSHTAEAYSNAYDNLHNQPREWLNVALAEWNASKKEIAGYSFVNKRYASALRASQKMLADDIVADAIWEKASEFQTCDNGGFNAWVCPFGCHTVSFDCAAAE